MTAPRSETRQLAGQIVAELRNVRSRRKCSRLGHGRLVYVSWAVVCQRCGAMVWATK